jgi:DNA-binding beta-propeller fold protein YncE
MQVTRSRRLLALAVAAAAAVVALAAVLVLALWTGDGGDARAFGVPGHPASLVRTPEAVWVAVPGSGSLLALDPRSGLPRGRPLRIGGSPSRLAAGSDSLWVVDSRRAAVIPVRRDPPRAFDAIPVGADATDAALAGGAVWVLSSAEGIVRAIEPGGRPVRELQVGSGAVDLAADGGWVVVASAGSRWLARIDATHRRLAGAPVRLGGVPVAAAVTGDSAWVADAEGGTVVEVDLRSGRLAGEPIDVGRRPVAVAADGDDVYVLCRGDRTLVHIAGGDVRSRHPAGADPVALALDGTHVWVADGGEDAVLRYDR